MSVLLIVESPAKVKTISSYLGKEYRVVATFGHVLDLPPDKLGVKIQKDFEPEYVLLKGKKKVLSSILKEAKSSDRILIATDPDREGEFIGSILADKIGLKKKIQRIRFQEISPDAIRRAMENPLPIDKDLVDSQKARRILDRLIGYLVSPFLWKGIGSGLSAGRVQSVALKWICEREKEIREFLPVESWIVSANVRYGKGEKETLSFFPNRDAFSNKVDAEKFLSDILKKTNVLEIQSRTEKKGETLPPPPFTTSTLQQEAFRVLKFPASKTMRLAQDLYEGTDLGKGRSQGLITYMRTDSVRMSEEAVRKIRSKISTFFGKEFVSEKAISYRSKKTGIKSQDAHEAIRPVDIFLEPNELGRLGKDAKNLYELIWKRTIASQMRSEKWIRIVFLASAGSTEWKGEAVFTLDPGYKKIYGVLPENFPSWQKGDSLHPESWDVASKTTEPPPRYTEASLVSKMEKEGIGRPSTFANILETLYKRKYASNEKGRIFASVLGEKVNLFLQSAFSELFREKFTSEMEDKLDRIAEGEESRSRVLGDFYSLLESNLKKADAKKISAEWKAIPKTSLYGICPVCKQGYRVQKKSAKKKTYYVCSRFPECDYAEYAD